MTAPTDFIEVPSGALCGASIVLTCKGPDEERSYVIDLHDDSMQLVSRAVWRSPE